MREEKTNHKSSTTLRLSSPTESSFSQKASSQPVTIIMKLFFLVLFALLTASLISATMNTSSDLESGTINIQGKQNYTTGLILPNNNTGLVGTWNNPTNMYSSTDSNSSANTSTNGNTHTWYGFVMGIPLDNATSNTTINGILVQTLCKVNTSASGKRNISINVSNGTSWSSVSNMSENLTTTYINRTHGNLSGVWGLGWTASSANAINVSVKANMNNGTILCDAMWVNINYTVLDNEVNKTLKQYNYSTGTIYNITSINVTVSVSGYTNASSKAKGNSVPNLFIRANNGTAWIDVGLLNITGIGNFSIMITEPSVLSAWSNNSYRNITIQGVYFDANVTSYDELNYTGVWISINSTEAPSVTDVLVNPILIVNGSTFNISANVTSTNAISSVKARIYYPNGTSAANYSLSNSGGGSIYWNASCRANFSLGGIYTVIIYANDSVGKFNDTVQANFTLIFNLSLQANIIIDGSFGDWVDGTNVNDLVGEPGGTKNYNFIMVSAGYDLSCGVHANGKIYCWGRGDPGLLGDGNTGIHNVGLATALNNTNASNLFVNNFRSVSVGIDHSCGVHVNGTVYCWGFGASGILGDGNNGSHSVGLATALNTSGGLVNNFSSVSAGGSHSCGVHVNGKIYCWGRGDSGLLGDGDTTAHNVALATALNNTNASNLFVNNFSSVSAGVSHTCGVHVNGTVYCWGSGWYGALGDGNTANHYAPLATALNTSGGLVNNFSSVSASYDYSCGVRVNGSAYCWGEGGGAQLGNGDTIDRGLATALNTSGGLINNFSSVSAASGYGDQSCGVHVNGTVYCWGHSSFGELGDGDAGDHYVLLATTLNKSGGLVNNFSSVSTGGIHSCGVHANGTVYCWGLGTSGRLGDGDNSTHNVGLATPLNRSASFPNIFDFQTVSLANNATYLFAKMIVNDNIDFSNASRYYAVYISTNDATTGGQYTAGGGLLPFLYDYRIQVNGSVCTVYNYTNQSRGTCDFSNDSNTIELRANLSLINMTTSSIVNITFETGSAGSSSYDFAPDYNSFLQYIPASVDSIPPTVSINISLDGFFTSNTQPSVDFNFSDSGSITANCTLYFNNTAYNTTNNINRSTQTTLTVNTALSNANYSVYVNCTDQSNNVGKSSVIRIIIDTTPPIVNATIPANNNFTNNNQPNFYFNYSDNLSPNASCTLYVGSTAYGTNSSVRNYTRTNITANDSISDGSYSWNVTCTDRAGNYQGSAARTITIDTITPSVTDVSATPRFVLNGTAVNISANVTDTSGLSSVIARIYYPNGTSAANYTMTNSSGSIYWNASYIAGFSPSGTYTFTIWAYDTPGNINNSVNSNFIPILNLSQQADIGVDGTFDDWSSITNVNDLVGDGFHRASFSSVSAGYTHSCGVSVNGMVYCWGEGTHGQLGDGNNGTHYVGLPTALNTSGGLVNNFSSVSTGFRHTCAVHVNGTVYCWGYGNYGQLGDGIVSDHRVGLATALNNTGASNLFVNNFSSVSAGRNHNCGVHVNGTVYCWGYGTFGQLGSGSASSSSLARALNNTNASNLFVNNFSSVSAGQAHSCGVHVNGSVYCWGNGDYGQLGDGNINVHDVLLATPLNRSGGLVNNFSRVTTYNLHSCGVHVNGSVYCWGYGNYGILGDGMIANHNAVLATPLNTSGGLVNNFSSVNPGGYHSCGVHANGTVYCWGYGDYGRLGDGNTDPHNVSLATTLNTSGGLVNNFSSVSAGQSHSCGVHVDDTVYCWGYGGNGTLGDGNTANHNVGLAAPLNNTNASFPAIFDFQTVSLANNNTYLFAKMQVNDSIDFSDSSRYYAVYISTNDATTGSPYTAGGGLLPFLYDYRIQVNGSACAIYNYTNQSLGTCDFSNDSNTIELRANLSLINMTTSSIVNITFETGSVGSSSYDFAPDYNSFLSYDTHNIIRGERAAENNCTNGLDDDSDGYTDYYDADCLCDRGNASTTCYVNSTHTINVSGYTGDNGFNNLVIESTGMLTHLNNSNSQSFWINISCVNLTIDAGGSINVSGKGYAGSTNDDINGNGPGNGTSGTTAGDSGGAGAGHGGKGGTSQSSYPGGNTYDSITNPTQIGSGGGAGFADKPGGNGGGLIIINATNNINITGTITADGNPGTDGTAGSSWAAGGGGSAGSIYLTTQTITGTGTINANGGNGGNDTDTNGDGGGGAGGRISIYYTTKTYTGTITNTGGTGNNAQHGGAGTTYLKATTESYGGLIINNYDKNTGITNITENITLNWANITNSTITGTNITSNPINITDSLNILPGTLYLNTPIKGTSKVTIQNGSTLTHTNNTNTQTYYINITCTNFTIESGGSINTTGKGYTGSTNDDINGNGPGNGTSGTTAGDSGGAGAGHGGKGGTSQSSYPGGNTYDSITNPTQIGSGGGAGFADKPGGNGGGLIIINATNNINITGTITADGNPGTDGTAGSSWAAGGGGSAGSIYLTTQTITGTGTINANGGNGGNDTDTNGDGGGGAGGRIAIIYTTYCNVTTFITTITNTTTGGTGYSAQSGGNGTIFYGCMNNPPSVNLSTPPNNTAQSITSINFSWLYSDPNNDPQWGFNLVIDNNSDFSSPEFNITENTTNTYRVVTGFNATTYYWKVMVLDNDTRMNSSGAWSSWSDTWKFRTINITINWVNASPNPAAPGQAINISANITGSAISTVRVLFNGAYYPMSNGGSGSIYWNKSISTATSANYTYIVYANDTSGNNVSMNGTVFVGNINISINLNPNPAPTSKNVSVYGHLNQSTGVNVTNNTIYIYFNGTQQLWDSATSWWNTSFAYRKKINITSYVPTNLNYTLNLVNFSTYVLISQAKMRGDCGDTRFADSNGNELQYTIETSTCNTTNTMYWIWINLTGNANNTIWAYYGNSGTALKTDYTNPDSSLVLYMHLDNDTIYGESSTNVFDFSRNGNNATCSGTGCATWTSGGDYAGAYQFNGTSNYFTVSPSSSLNITNGITISAWIRFTVIQNYQTIVAKRDASAAEANYAFRTDGGASNDELSFYFSNGGWQVYVTNNANMLAGNWYHVVATYNNSAVKIYKDGVLLTGGCTSGTCAVALQTENNNVAIGRAGDYTGSEYFNGLIDEVRLYNRSLSSDEILAIYNSTMNNYISNQTLTKTDSNGNYDYTITTPITAGIYNVSVNTTYNGMYAQANTTLTVYQNYINISLNLNPNPVPTLKSLTISGHINDSDGTNVTNNPIKIYINNSEVNNSLSNAIGGTITTILDGGLNYTIHTFTESGTFYTTKEGEVEYLVVAGGGGGGHAETGTGGDGAGGGGGGGFITDTFVITAGSHEITVGLGGPGSTDTASKGTNGGNSSIDNDVVALGGGGGGSDNHDNTNIGADGGSGGGAASKHDETKAGGSGDASQGHNGGSAGNWLRGGGGGGGASSAGVNSVSNTGSNGGNGSASNISGSPMNYSGGGGGGSCDNVDGGTGGSGGGGKGGWGWATGDPGDSAIANIGGGGGGGGAGGTGTAAGGAGGSGIVIIKYLTSSTDANGNYNYTITAPATPGNYIIKVNTTYNGMSAEKTSNLTVYQNYINISLNLTPNPVNISGNVSIYGHVNESEGSNVVNNPVNVYINNILYYYNNNTGLLENTTLWWNISFGYRTKINVTSLVSTNMNNTITLVNLSTSTFVAQGKMKSDCGDTRFTDINGNELQYTIETSTCNSTNTIFWVWMNLTGNANNTIWAYYGNSEATSPTYTSPDQNLVLLMHLDSKLLADSSNDYSNVSQGTNSWYYYWSAAGSNTYTQLVQSTSAYTWVVANPSSSYEFLYEGQSVLHPGSTTYQDPVRAWSSTVTGQVTILATISDGDAGGGDGINYTINQNTQQLFTQSYSNGFAQTTINLTITVSVGDMIYFRVNRKGNQDWDTTNERIQIFTTNPLVDGSGRGNNGTGNGAIQNASGRYGGAFQFDGTNDYVSVADSNSLDATNAITISVWINPTSVSNKGILMKGALSDSQGVYSLLLDPSAGYPLRFRLNGGTSDGSGQASSTTDMSTKLNTWTHVVGTYNGSRQKVYINGVLEGNQSYSTAISADANPLYIGGYYSTSYLFPGMLDDVRIYNRSLSADEILAIYNSTTNNYIINHSLPRTDSSGNYNYTFTAPSTAGNYPVKVNTTYNGMSAEATGTLTVQASGGGGVNCSGYKCFITRSNGNPVAIFDALGALDLKASLTQSASSSPGGNDFIIRNSTGTPVAWINASGNFFIKGTLSENNGVACTPPTNSFFIKGNNSECVAYVNNTGDLWIKGDLRESVLT